MAGVSGALSGAGSGAAAGTAILPGWGTAIGAVGGAIIGGLTGNAASQDMQEAQGQAQNVLKQQAGLALAPQQQIYGVGSQNLNTLSNNVASGAYNTNPYAYSAQGAQNGLNMPGSNLGAGFNQGANGGLPSQYQLQNFNMKQSPGYQFQLQQGLNSIQNSAAAGGGALSGATMKAMQQYGTGLAAQDYQNMFNNYMKQQGMGQDVQNQAYNQYAGQQKIGMENAQQTFEDQLNQQKQAYGMQEQLASYAQPSANAISNINTSLGAGLANSYVGQGQAQAQGISQIGASVQSGLTSLGQLYDLSQQKNPQAPDLSYNYQPGMGDQGPSQNTSPQLNGPYNPEGMLQNGPTNNYAPYYANNPTGVEQGPINTSYNPAWISNTQPTGYDANGNAVQPPQTLGNLNPAAGANYNNYQTLNPYGQSWNNNFGYQETPQQPIPFNAQLAPQLYNQIQQRTTQYPGYY
jgi:hypothetical protein